MYVIQQCNGTGPGVTTTTKGKALDNGQSAIWAGSTFIQFNEQGESVATPKQTDDKIVLGYTYDGLPFQIVVDGMLGCNRNHVFKFIDEQVTPLMDQYSRELSDLTKTPDQVTKDLIQTLIEIRPNYQQVDFTMSLVMTYERNGALQCSGFGVGDTAIALRRGTGEIEQLVTTNTINGLKDTFEDTTMDRLTLDELLTRNTIFTSPININNELVGYTWVHDALQETKEQTETLDSKGRGITIQKIGLNIPKLEKGTLYDYLLRENTNLQKNNLDNKETGGDDTTLGQIFVPTPELRAKLKKAHLIDLEANIEAIDNSDLKAKATAVLHAAQELIHNGKNVDSVMQQVALTNQLLTSAPGDARAQLLNEYMNVAEQARTAAGNKALGIAMLALGAAVAVCGLMICLGTLGLGAPVGAAISVVGGGLIAAGLGVFGHNKQAGLSQAMKDLAVAEDTSVEANTI